MRPKFTFNLLFPLCVKRNYQTPTGETVALEDAKKVRNNGWIFLVLLIIVVTAGVLYAQTLLTQNSSLFSALFCLIGYVIIIAFMCIYPLCCKWKQVSNEQMRITRGNKRVLGTILLAGLLAFGISFILNAFVRSNPIRPDGVIETETIDRAVDNVINYSHSHLDGSWKTNLSPENNVGIVSFVPKYGFLSKSKIVNWIIMPINSIGGGTGYLSLIEPLDEALILHEESFTSPDGDEFVVMNIDFESEDSTSFVYVKNISQSGIEHNVYFNGTLMDYRHSVETDGYVETLYMVATNDTVSGLIVTMDESGNINIEG